MTSKLSNRQSSGLQSWEVNLLWKSIKAICFLSVGEGNPHAGGERRVEDHSSTLKPRCQIDCRHRADALSVQDDILRADAVPETQKFTFQNKFWQQVTQAVP